MVHGSQNPPLQYSIIPSLRESTNLYVLLTFPLTTRDIGAILLSMLNLGKCVPRADSESPWAGAVSFESSWDKVLDSFLLKQRTIAQDCAVRVRGERAVTGFTDEEKFACAFSVGVPVDFGFLDEQGKWTMKLRYPVAVYSLGGRITVAYRIPEAEVVSINASTEPPVPADVAAPEPGLGYPIPPDGFDSWPEKRYWLKDNCPELLGDELADERIADGSLSAG